MDGKEFGGFVAARRREKGMTQAELAQQLHVTDKAVSKWERGLNFPDINTLEPLAEALHITVAELLQCHKIEQSTISVREADELLAKLALYQAELRRHQVAKCVCILLLGFSMVFAALLGDAVYVLSVTHPNSAFAEIWQTLSVSADGWGMMFQLPLQVLGVLGVFLIRWSVLNLK